MSSQQKPVVLTTPGEIVDPKHTCLVIWDVQNSLVNDIFNKVEFLENIKEIISAARGCGVPIVYTKITRLPLDFESPWRLYNLMKRFHVDDPQKLPPYMAAGSSGAEIPGEIAPTPSDLVLNKHTPNIFTGTHFDGLMRNRGIKTIIFTGISTEIGIDTSARDCGSRGFYTVVVEDAVSSPDKESHFSALALLRKVCIVLSRREIIAGWAKNN